MSLISQELIILTSPPASGKTFWISSLGEFLPGELLVISPLRALADECRLKWKTDIVIMTPEEWLGKREKRRVVIFDEYHLFLYWGDSFRPLMWEVFYELTQTSELTILLTATMSLEMRELLQMFNTQFDSILLCDFGNQQLKNLPQLYLKAPSKAWIINEIEHQPPGMPTGLIFCKYRQEVLELEKKLNSLGYSCVSCVGGESKYMKDKLLITPEPDFILSTTVLSHGVNLPAIRKIFFLYEVNNMDFWIQMVARGGRRGEKYQVIALEKPYHLKWNPIHNYLRICFMTLKQFLSLHRISF